MHVLSLAYTKRLGIKPSTIPGYLLELPASPNVLNHLQTVHASASYSLAEISSGYFLRSNFADIADQTIPILRGSQVKYKKSGKGSLFSVVRLNGTNVKEIRASLETKRKALFFIQVKVYNDEKELVMLGDYEWFVTLK